MCIYIYIYIQGFPRGSDGKESACNAGDLGSILGLGRSLEKGKATPSGILAWRIPCIAHGVAKSQAVSFHFTDSKFDEKCCVQRCPI